MGATGWRYVVPYQAEMADVLRDLKREVFLGGRYEKPTVDLSALDEFGFFDVDEEERERMMAEFTLGPLRKPIGEVGLEGLRDWLAGLDAAASVRTVEELEALQCLSDSGTGSILDIAGVSPERSLDAIFPLSRPQLLDFFGTDRPARQDVETWAGRVVPLDESPLYGRGEGIYVVLYKDGRPDEVYIEGASGD